MKALSIRQPWAALVAAGAKRYETRSWPTAHRGPLAIHASTAFAARDRALCGGRLWADALGIPLGDSAALPLGRVLAVCELVACVRTEDLGLLPEPERLFGDFRPGRWAWRLERVHRLATPVPVRGRLGLWEWPGAVDRPPAGLSARSEVPSG